MDKNPTCSEFFSVVKGSGTLVLDGVEKCALGTGDVVLIDRNKGFRFVCNEPTEYFSLQFNIADFINEEAFVFEKKEVSVFLSLWREPVQKMNGLHVNVKKIQELLFLIENEFENRTDSSTFLVKSYMLLVFALIMQYFSVNAVEEKGEYSAHYKNIEKSISYIHEHLSEKVTLDELAKIAMMGKTNYSVTFKKITGMTVWEYILNARIELATNYLMESNGEYNITELAFLCGFNDSAHFNKTFKKLKGKTPRDFKKDSGNPCF